MNDQSSPPSLPLLDAFQNESSDSSSDYDRIDYIQSSGISIDTFDYPVAITSAVYERCVVVPEKADWQDESGRLWDLVWMTRVAISQESSRDRNRVPVWLYVQNDSTEPKLTELVAVVGPGDNLEPVITVLFPDED